jgi:VanZ family protein
MIRIASLCLIVYWVAIFTATHLPGSTLPTVAGSDKIHHMLAYTGLAFLLGWAIPSRESRLRQLSIVVLIAIAYAGLDELTQAFIPGRHGDPRDWAADVVGIVCGITIYALSRQLLSGSTWGRRLIQSLSR